MNKRGKLGTVLIFLLIVVLTVGLALAHHRPGHSNGGSGGVKECRDGIDNDGDGNVDWPADAGCGSKNDDDESNCGDGVCEGGETSSSCAADCGPVQVCGNNMIEGTETCDGTDLAGQTCVSQGFDGGALGCASGCGSYDTSGCFTNTCADTDGGSFPTIFGTTTGSFGGSSYSNNDVCLNADDVLEYSCSGAIEISQQFNCGTDISFDECLNGDVYTNATDFGCSAGACGSSNSFTLKETCQNGCTSGVCDPVPSQPDLIVSNLQFIEYESVTANSTIVLVNATATVKNIGTGVTSGPSILEFAQTSFPISDITPVLNPGEEDVATITYLCDFAHNLVVTADADNHVVESDELNNQWIESIDCIV